MRHGSSCPVFFSYRRQLATQPAQPEASGEIDLALLVSEGLIQPGTVLVARPAVLNGATAAVGLDGRVLVGGVGYETPSAAGVAANSAGLYLGGINGWRGCPRLRADRVRTGRRGERNRS